MKTLIKNATVVTPRQTLRCGVLIDGKQIAAINPAIQARADEVIDASGLHLLPGVIDDQVHFREPGLTHKEDLHHASRACAKGGVTTFLEMPNTKPETISRARLDEKLALAATKSLVNYGFYIGATPNNLSELKAAHRTPGIKIFIGSSTGDLLVDDQEALERIFAETTIPITAHCEDEATVRANRVRLGDELKLSDHSRIRNHAAALIATKRAIDLATRHKHNFHVLHVSTAAEVEPIAAARPYITAEICLHHLFFNTDDYDRLGSLVQMNPSIKTKADNDALFAALLAGKIQVIATDHAPHTLDEKRQPYPKSPSGLPAVENSLALMLNQVHLGRCTVEQVVHWMCEAPARVWNILNKGKIEVGYDADIVLVDLERVHTILNTDQVTKCGWTPWDGVTLTGLPLRTWVMGKEIYCEEKFNDAILGSEAKFDPKLGGYWATEV